MPLQRRKDPPPGYAIIELPNRGGWQAHKMNDRERMSPVYSRRIQAVNWAWIQEGIAAHEGEMEDAEA